MNVGFVIVEVVFGFEFPIQASLLNALLVLASADRLDEVIYSIREVAKNQSISPSTIEGETTECHCTDTKLLEAD